MLVSCEHENLANLFNSKSVKAHRLYLWYDSIASTFWCFVKDAWSIMSEATVEFVRRIWPKTISDRTFFYSIAASVQSLRRPPSCAFGLCAYMQ
jgi:hypothetical protein